MQNKYTSYETLNLLRDAKSISSGTSLITLYVPGNTSMSIVSNQLSSELSTSQNIKSKSVRSGVQSAIKSCQQQIKLLGTTAPENGLVLCAGEIQSCI